MKRTGFKPRKTPLRAKSTLKSGTGLKTKARNTTKSVTKSAKPSVAKLKKIADKYYSLYVRMRDSDLNGYGNCITCGARKHYKEAQAGHFVSRGRNLLRYDDENVNLQCVACNMFKSGEQYAYSLALDLKYGTGTADKLWKQRNQIHQFKVDELQEIIANAKEFIDWWESHATSN